MKTPGSIWIGASAGSWKNFKELFRLTAFGGSVKQAKIWAPRLGRPLLLAAAAVVVAAAAVIALVGVAAATAVTEQEDQNDDPPQVVTAEAATDTIVITAHKNTSEDVLERFCRSFHGIPKVKKCAAPAPAVSCGNSENKVAKPEPSIL